MEDTQFMELALALAREAAEEGEVPVGCVVTLGDRVVGRGRNRRESLKNALSHAELEAIDEACKTLKGWRLSLAVRSICSTVLALDQDAMACITVEGATPEGNYSSLFAPVPWTPQWINQ